MTVIVILSVYIYIFWWYTGPLVRCIGRVLVGGEGPLVFEKDMFPTVCRYVGWSRSELYWYVIIFNRRVYV